MRFEKNSRMSRGQNTRQINIRYFFIKDRIKYGNINIIYDPTEMMVADYFTKPLQGVLFRDLRNVIMGVTLPNTLAPTTTTLVKECVEEHVKLPNCKKMNKHNTMPTGDVHR